MNSSTQITAVTPAFAMTADTQAVNVTVTNTDGSITSSSAYTYNKVPIIYVTSETYTRNLGGFSGANDKCNAAAGKPTATFASQYIYKALLNSNNATTSGITYYRTDGTTSIATAIGGNLVGANSLNHAISTCSISVWTGADGTNNCTLWTSTVINKNGKIGSASSSTSQYWNSALGLCTTQKSFYCVSQ